MMPANVAIRIDVDFSNPGQFFACCGLSINASGPSQAQEQLAGYNAAIGETSAMRILVIGGTRFTGPLVVSGLVERGHEVSVFHRGEHEHADLPPQVRHLHGDRRDEAKDELEILHAVVYGIESSLKRQVSFHTEQVPDVHHPAKIFRRPRRFKEWLSERARGVV